MVRPGTRDGLCAAFECDWASLRGAGGRVGHRRHAGDPLWRHALTGPAKENDMDSPQCGRRHRPFRGFTSGNSAVG